MAYSNPRYLRSSTKDDFSYGSYMASASVHICMDRSAFPRPVQLLCIRPRWWISGFRGTASSTPDSQGERVLERKHFAPPPLGASGLEHLSCAQRGELLQGCLLAGC
ncbi:unnamed protein product [Pipistrellus nathusii]|uniref:Uncharacterized protein n=1 Tax=Pipistrellus nathusii TaxID=59473 RepID=A0ABN9ZX68_PIPNA